VVVLFFVFNFLTELIVMRTNWNGGRLVAWLPLIFLMACSFFCSSASFADTTAAKVLIIPSPIEVIGREVFVWVMLGGFLGYVFNARSADYEGIKSVLERHGFSSVPGWVTMPLDLAFFAVLGPIIVTGVYGPQELFQGVTLGAGWPLVIRGAIANLTKG
jgi:hypothetical protein